MIIHELSAVECRKMLGRTNIARLACAHNNQPYVVPIRIDLHDRFLYGYATLGQKIEWMRENPLVCVEIDEVHTLEEWTSIIVFGRYEELPNTPAFSRPRKIAERLFQVHPSWWQPATVPLVEHEQRAPVVFRIQIVSMTGRRAERPARASRA